MKLSKLLCILLSSITTVFSYENNNTGPVQIPSDVPTDCVTLFQIYEHFNLGRPGYIVGDVMFNCCYYEVRRLHSMDVYATTEWECENDSQNPDNHITSIILNDKNLSGEIPWVLINSFQNLQILYLNNNKLTGELSQLSYLKGLNNLQRVNLSSNQLTGLLPTDLPPNLTVLNVQNNDIVGPIPDTWTSKSNFNCYVPTSICISKSLSSYNSMCNSTPNSSPLSKCTDEQEMMTTNSLSNKNNTNNNNNNNNDDDTSLVNANNDMNDSENVVNNKEETAKSEEEKKTSRAVIITFFSIIFVLGILVLLVAIFAKYKNNRHEREMEDSLRRHRESLQRIQTQEDSFLRDTAVKSIDENDNFTLSKYSESFTSGTRRNGNGSDVGSRGLGGIGEENEAGNHAHERAILMKNIDGNGEVFDNEGEFDNAVNQNSSKTIDLNRSHSQTDPSYSYSFSSNKYNTTSTSLYDSSYCSTCDCSYSTVSSASSLSTNNSSFTEANESSFSLTCNESNLLNKNSEPLKDIITDEIGSNVTLDNSLGFDNKHYLAKRSIISNSSYNTLIDQNLNNNLISTNPLINNSLVSSPATVITSTSSNTKFVEEDNLKIKLEDIEEEHSSSLSKISPTSIDFSGDLGKSINMSFILKDSSFFNENNQDGILLNW